MRPSSFYLINISAKLYDAKREVHGMEEKKYYAQATDGEFFD